MEIHCVLNRQDGIAQSAVVLVAFSCGGGCRLCNNQSSFLQLHNILPHGVDTHADGFADESVTGPAPALSSDRRVQRQKVLDQRRRSLSAEEAATAFIAGENNYEAPGDIYLLTQELGAVLKAFDSHLFPFSEKQETTGDIYQQLEQSAVA